MNQVADEEKVVGLEDETHFGDSSGPVFHMYSKVAEQDDNTMAERWQKDADGILIYAGLFSAAVATFLSISISDLRPNSQDISAFYLRNIYQNLSDPSASVPSTSSTVATPPPFSQPSYAIAVNLLWVVSLCMSLTCAIMATMLQQWARQYVRFTQPQRRSPKKRARIRALLSGSADKSLIRIMCILLPCYLHLAVFLFFIGLLVFFFNVNKTIFATTLVLFLLCMAVYSFVTVLPFFQSDSLLFTPISAFPASCVTLLICLVHITFGDRFKIKNWRIFDWLFEDVRSSGAVEKISSMERAPEIDAKILESTLNSLNEDDATEDDATEKFFAAIPDFLKLLPTDFLDKNQDAFKESLYGFLDSTFRSTKLAESVKFSRLIIGLDASHATLGPDGPSWILRAILNRNWPELLQSVELGHTLRSWVHGNDEKNVLYIRNIISHIVASAEKRDHRWRALAADQPGMSEDLLRHYPAHGDSVLLANTSSHQAVVDASHANIYPH